jgi:hypothetical protein
VVTTPAVTDDVRRRGEDIDAYLRYTHEKYT